MYKRDEFDILGSMKSPYEEVIETLANVPPEQKEPILTYTMFQWVLRKDIPTLEEENDVLRYLLALEKNVVYEEHPAKKPHLEAIRRCFERQLTYLRRMKVHNKTAPFPPWITEREAVCKTYLQNCNDDAWYANLPNEIRTRTI